MNAKKRVVILGLIPEVVDYNRWPGLTPEKLIAQLTADEGKLNALGYEAQLCLVDLGETAEATVTQTLTSANICFNSKPSHTAEAVQRWV
jgi:hypothetical protein